jgi:predicted nucleic acid-binding protein
MRVVIDTNVTIVANGRSSHASPRCQFACISFLEEIVSIESRTKIALDANGQILAEYKDYLSYSGQPGVGDIFFKYLHDSMYKRAKVQLIQITPINDETRGFKELPINSLDKSDRKFLAVAVKSKANITNAVDTDWHEHRDFIKTLRVRVQQLCPEHAA